jgi:hypothetical protein
VFTDKTSKYNSSAGVNSEVVGLAPEVTSPATAACKKIAAVKKIDPNRIEPVLDRNLAVGNCIAGPSNML